MKKKPYDYSGFSLSRLNEPRFSHIKLLGGWIFYFTMYFVTENLIPREACHPIHCALDDMIPFNELAGVVLPVFVAVSLVIGGGGSAFAIRKFLQV